MNSLYRLSSTTVVLLIDRRIQAPVLEAALAGTTFAKCRFAVRWYPPVPHFLALVSFRADIDLTMQLTQDYATALVGAEHATLKAAPDVGVSDRCLLATGIIAAINEADVDDEIKTFMRLLINTGDSPAS